MPRYKSQTCLATSALERLSSQLEWEKEKDEDEEEEEEGKES